MTSDISTAILKLEVQCFPNSEGKGFPTQSSYPNKLSNLEDPQKYYLPCALSGTSRRCILPEREREETKKEDSEVGSRKQGLPHEEEANRVQYDDEWRDQDDGHAVGFKSCKSREEQEARGLGEREEQGGGIRTRCLDIL